MKLVIFALLFSTAAAFTSPALTFAVSKKAPAKKVVAKKVASGTKAVKKVVAKAKKVVAKTGTKAVAKKVVAAKKVAVKKVAKTAVKAKKVVVAAKKVVAKKAAADKKVVKKVVRKVIKASPVAKKVIAKTSPTGTIPSVAIPYEEAPALLDGSLVGDVGFDPCFLSTKADGLAPYFNGILGGKANLDGLTWYREAELMHGRICMVAVLGFIVPGFTTFAGNDWTGADAYSYTNPLEALDKAPGAALFQIFGFMSLLEFRRINIIQEQGSSYMAGDSQRWGQGNGRWNPLKFDYTPEEYETKQLQEIKHARLAMVAILGLYFQANISGISVVDQWSAAFTVPDYAAKAGYFLPQGI